MTDFYRRRVERELERWRRKMLKSPGLLERNSKKLQNKINARIPHKVQDGITTAIRGMFQAVLFGLDFMPKNPPLAHISLAERDTLAQELLIRYQKIAAAEGAGTGAGGFVAGLADFPALVAIKLKFLFELAHLYGYSTEKYEERVFILCVFQLAFSSREKRKELLERILGWQERHSYAQDLSSINWEQLQTEYRDAIDFRKTLQLLPGVGAVVGAWANYGLLEDLGETAINCYRLRVLQEEKGGVFS